MNHTIRAIRAIWPIGAIRASALVLVVLSLTAGLALPRPATAHQFAPALLELEELTAEDGAADDIEPMDATLATVRWKQPIVRVQGSRLQPVLPADCVGVGDPTVEREGLGMRASWRIRCPGGLSGKTVGVEGIAASRADVLLRVALADGTSLRRVLTAEEPSFEITGEAGAWGVVESYGVLGFEHILAGWDHLLFVLALVLLVGWGRTLVWTVTAFTLGHSVTLALASLGLVHVPQAPIEAAIAVSIYVLAVELALTLRDGRKTLTQRFPWAVAAAFGLLHGLGFAGALSEAGLPEGEIPLALFAFNLGIELGQLAFVGVVLATAALLKALPVRWPAAAKRAPAYGIGVMAVYWVCERVWGMFG